MAKKVLQTGKFKFEGTEYPVTAFDFTEAYDEVDVTDTGTSGDGREFLGSRANRTFTVTMWMEAGDADLAMNVDQASTEIDFEGKVYAGTVRLLQKTNSASIDAGVQQTYNGRFQGAVTVTPEA